MDRSPKTAFSKPATTHTGRILIVDDDPIVAGMLGVSLSAAGHDINEIYSGEEALFWLVDQAEGQRPDLVILDIEMPPGIDGYETCRRLHAIDAMRDLPVIFLSSHDRLEDRLHAYDAGGSDFMAKPFVPEEVLRKTEVMIRRQRQQAVTIAESKSSIDAAVAALNSFGEIGVSLKFSRSALGCRSRHTLASLVIESMRMFGVDCHVQLRTPSETLTLTSRGLATPLDESVIGKMQSMGRLFSFKNRTIINHKHVSLLITDMPIADENLCGRIRDQAAMIAEAAELSASNIGQRTEALVRADELRQLADTSRLLIEDLRGNYQGLLTSTRLELEQLVTAIEGMYNQLNLANDEEHIISDTLRDAVNRIMALFEQSSQLDQNFAGISSCLSMAGDHCLFQANLDEESSDHGSEATLAVELW